MIDKSTDEGVAIISLNARVKMLEMEVGILLGLIRVIINNQTQRKA